MALAVLRSLANPTAVFAGLAFSVLWRIAARWLQEVRFLSSCFQEGERHRVVKRRVISTVTNFRKNYFGAARAALSFACVCFHA